MGPTGGCSAFGCGSEPEECRASAVVCSHGGPDLCAPYHRPQSCAVVVVAMAVDALLDVGVRRRSASASAVVCDVDAEQCIVRCG